MKFLIGLKDKAIRFLSNLVILSAFDGKKKEIMRILQGINLVVLGLAGLNPEWATALDEHWRWLLALGGHIGLEFAIEDEEVKIKKGLDPKVVRRLEIATKRKR